MSHKKTVGILLGLSVLCFVVGILFTTPEQYGICPLDTTFSCIEPLGNNIGQPLFMGSLVLVIIFLILFFLPHNFFRAWLKYVAWFIPVAILWIATSDVNCGGYLPVCFDKELATWWSSGIFLVLSLIVIIAASFQRRKPPIYTPGV